MLSKPGVWFLKRSGGTGVRRCGKKRRKVSEAGQLLTIDTEKQ